MNIKVIMKTIETPLFKMISSLGKEATKENVIELLKLYEDGYLKPHISSIYNLEEGAKAISDLEQRKAKGKVVVQVKT